MQNKEIVEFFEKLVSENGVLEIPEDVFIKMEIEYGLVLVNEFTKTHKFRLPKFEIRFFEWLKENDYPVWKDLWLDDNPVEDLYVVSIDFLPNLLNKDGRGFPICDLVSIDNYYFSIEQMVDEESKMIIESATNRFMAKDNLTTAQLLALEISIAPIDIWHFAYKHKIEISEAKKAVEELVNDNALVHFKDSEHIAKFIK